MKRNLVILGVIFLIAINVSVLATVGYRWRCGDRACGGCAPGEYLDMKLALSDAQKQKMEVLRKAFIERTDEKREVLGHKRNELLRLLNERSPDRAKVDCLIREIGIAQAELEKEVVDHILQQKEMLTPEQQQEFLGLIKGRLLHREKCEEVICPSERR